MRRLINTPLRTFGLLSMLSFAACAETDDTLGQPGFDSSLPPGDSGSFPAFDTGVQQPGFDGGAPKDSGTAGAFDGTGMPCAVQAILRDKCANCHAAEPLFGAPMSLASFAALQAPSKLDPSKKVAAASQVRINSTDPSKPHMPPTNQPQLDATQLATLNAWLAAGAPQSNETCSTPQPGDGGVDSGVIDTTGLECYKLVAHAAGNKATKYAVGSAKDKYVNFSFAAPWTGPAYGIVMRPIIDNAKVLHHWLLFQTVGANDGAVETSSGAHPTGDLVHGWAPGGNSLDFRVEGDVGYDFPAGTGFQVEIHYNSTDGTATDASGVEVCVQKNKPKDIAGVSWLGTDIFNGTSAKSTCSPTANIWPIHIMAVSPHMHLKGKYMKAMIVRANGTTETLRDGPFDFNDQTWYPGKFTLNKGDKIETECTFSAPSTFGKATTAEMCYLFTVAYPKGALTDKGFVGTAAHGGGACLGI